MNSLCCPYHPHFKLITPTECFMRQDGTGDWTRHQTALMSKFATTFVSIK